MKIPLTLSAPVAKAIDAAIRDRWPTRILLLTITVSAAVIGEKKQTREVVAALNEPGGPF